MRTGVTIQDVTRAADQLLTAGERPTVESVRALLGTGAPATVNQLLKDYYQTLGGRLTLPPEVAGAAAGLVESVRRTALAEADAREIEQHAQLERECAQLATDRATFEQERMQLRDRVAALGADLQQLVDIRGGLERRVGELEHDLVDQTRRAAGAEASASAAIEERKRLEDRHRSELQDLGARAEGNERHFLAQIEEGRAQLKRLQNERDKESATAARRIGDLESRLATATTELADLRSELSRRDAQLAGERSGRAEMEARLAQQTQHHDQELRRDTAEREAIQAELQRERSRNEELIRAHDQAIRDSALHQGRALALQGQLEDLRGRGAGKGSSGTQKAKSSEKQ